MKIGYFPPAETKYPTGLSQNKGQWKEDPFCFWQWFFFLIFLLEAMMKNSQVPGTEQFQTRNRLLQTWKHEGLL